MFLCSRVYNKGEKVKRWEDCQVMRVWIRKEGWQAGRQVVDKCEPIKCEAGKWSL